MKSNLFKIVDLSHPLSNSTLVYPGDPGVNIAQFKSIRLNNTAVSSLTFGSHSGTHLDAPRHVIENGADLNQIEPMNFFGVGRCLDVRNREQITDRDIPANIAAGQAVFFRTGQAQYWNSEKYYRTRPCLTTEAADALINLGVLAVGVDTPSVDEQGTQKKIIHEKLLAKNILIFENLANLDQLPVNDMFAYFGAPIPVENGDGAPARVFALVGDSRLVESIINFKSNLMRL